MAPTQKEQIEKLSTENSELKTLVEKLTEHSQQLSKRVENLEASLEVLGLQQSEGLTRIESVEENLCEVKTEQQEIRDDQASMMMRLETQQMYSRKQTLLVTGDAVKGPEKGEDVRKTVIHLFNEYLGIDGLQTRDICACHRMKNPKVILVRFLKLDDTDRIYRARTRPKKKGLLIFESLTSERLSVIRDLRELKKETDSKVLSYYTQAGKILVRTSENKEVRPTEIPFGLTKDQIRDLCKGKDMQPTTTEILDRFREVHNPRAEKRTKTGEAGQSRKDAQAWKKVTKGRNDTNKVHPDKADQGTSSSSK